MDPSISSITVIVSACGLCLAAKKGLDVLLWGKIALLVGFVCVGLLKVIVILIKDLLLLTQNLCPFPCSGMAF